MSKEKKSSPLKNVDPKDLMAVERSATALIGLSISLIVLGFIVEKFQLFLLLMSDEIKAKTAAKEIPQLQNIEFYSYLGIAITTAGIFLALYTYFYYKKWILLLQQGINVTDKNIYRILSFFVATIGLILVISMLAFS